MSFTIQSNYILFAFVALLTVSAVALLYTKRIQKNVFSKSMKTVLVSLRMFSIFIIVLLLFRPAFQWWKTTKVKPEIAIVVDESHSMVAGEDSLQAKKRIENWVSQLESKLSKKFKISTYGFDHTLHDNTSFVFQGVTSNYSSVTNRFAEDESHLNLVSMVLIGDGLYNIGANPINNTNGFPVPITTVAHGDTTSHRDGVVKQILTPEIAFLDRPFSLSVQVKQEALKGRNAVLTLKDGNKVVEKRTLNYTSENNFFEEEFEVTPQTKGFRRYRATLTYFEEEAIKENNALSVTVEVKDNKQKILMLYASLHPDLGALRKSLERTGEYDVKQTSIKNWNGDVKNTDLLVFHAEGLSKAVNAKVESKIKQSKRPTLYLFGGSNTSSQIKKHQSIVSLDNTSAKGELVAPTMNYGFSQFSLQKETMELLSTLPPLSSPYGTWNVKSNTSTLFFQSIQGIGTDYPLLCFSKGKQKEAVLVGEGLWRWALYDYVSSGSYDRFDDIINQTFSYLLLKENKEHLRLNYEKKLAEYEEVVFEAEVFDDVFNYVTDAAVELSLWDENKEKFVYGMLPQGKKYHANLNRMISGNYTFEVSAKTGEETFKKRGQFIIEDISLENLNKRADFSLMNTLAYQTGGLYTEMQREQSAQHLADSLIQRYASKHKEIAQAKNSSLIDKVWLLLLLVLTLTSEWVLRKYFGQI